MAKRLALLRYVPDEKQVFRFDGAIRSVVGRELSRASIAPASWQLLAAYEMCFQNNATRRPRILIGNVTYYVTLRTGVICEKSDGVVLARRKLKIVAVARRFAS